MFCHKNIFGWCDEQRTAAGLVLWCPGWWWLVSQGVRMGRWMAAIADFVNPCFFLLQLRMNFLRHKPLEPQFQPSTNICLSWLLCLVLFPYCRVYPSWRLWLDWWCSGFEHVWDVNENMLLHEIFLNGIVLSSWKGGPEGVWLTDDDNNERMQPACVSLGEKSVPPSAAFP